MTTFAARASGAEGPSVRLPADRARRNRDAALAADGVSCTVCHQISADATGRPVDVHRAATSSTPRPAGDGRPIFGPFAVDAGRTRVMQSSGRFTPTESTHVRQVGAVRQLPHAVHARAGAAARRRPAYRSRRPTSSGSRARSATRRAASRATCPSSQGDGRSRPCSASRARAGRGTRSAAATSSCSAC